MANIKELIQSIESTDSSFDEKLAVINEMQDTLIAMKEHEEEVIDDNVELIIEALRTIEAKVEAKLRIIPEKGEQGIQGPKGEKGEQGLDGYQGKDGKSGIDGKDGLDGKDGVSVQDAKIDFDGSLVITLSDGREINVGEVVPVDVAQTIHKIQSGSGGDSQTTLNAIAALQATIATYGTMALQNKTSVDIEGGTIDNTTIGATTPSTGVFTTLTATGQTSLGGVAGSEGLRVTPVASSNRYVVATGSNGGQPGFYASAGALGISGGATSGVSFYSNLFAQQQFNITHTASAVNYVQVTGAATGGRVTISSQGSDANVPVVIGTKGSGSLNVRTNDSATTQFAVTSTASAVNYINVTGATTTNAPVLSALGSDTNIPLVLQPKGTGALQAQQTDSTATGGNARGANAVDWQTSRSSASQVASGTQSFIGAGTRNTSSNFYTGVVAGYTNTASGFSSFIGSGNQHITSGTYSSITSGFSNVASNTYTSVVNGNSNTAAGYYNFIGNGQLNSGTSGSAVTTQSATMNGTTAVTLSGSNASIKVGQIISGTSIGEDTYVAAISGTSLTLSKVASGSSTSTLSFFTPHGVVVGGGNNQATGSYSYIGGGGDAGTAANRNVASGDWSVVVGGRKNTASGQSAFVGAGGDLIGSVFGNTASGVTSAVVGGFNNTASGYGGFVGGGSSNVASATYSALLGGNGNSTNSDYSSIVGGAQGTTRSIIGINAQPYCNNPLSSPQGASQGSALVLGVQTTDATATVLRSNSSAAGTTNQVILPNNSAYYFKGSVIANVTGGGNTKAWAIEGAIKRGANAASTALVGTPTVVSGFADVGAATWAIAVTADTTNGGLAVTFTGQAATTIRCVAKLETTEVTF